MGNYCQCAREDNCHYNLQNVSTYDMMVAIHVLTARERRALTVHIYLSGTSLACCMWYVLRIGEN